MEPGDLELLYRWENDPALWACGVMHQPIARHTLADFIESASEPDIYASRQMRLMGIDDEGNPVGCVDLYELDPYRRRAGIGLMVDGGQRRKGYGRAMVDAMVLFARQELQLHQLHCVVAVDNAASIALFEDCGFRRCGTYRDWVWDGLQWRDAHIYQKILAQ